MSGNEIGSDEWCIAAVEWHKNHMMPKESDWWPHWSKMEIVSLGEAVLLSQCCDPAASNVHSSDCGPFCKNPRDDAEGRTLRKIYEIALSSMDQEGGLNHHKRYKEDVPDDMPCVNLKEFGTWMRRKGIAASAHFPTKLNDLPALRPGWTSIAIPYDCQFMNQLAEIIFKNYTTIPDGTGPNQTKVALEIDEAVGWKNQKKHERASRTAVAIAAAIQPERFQKKHKYPSGTSKVNFARN
jgi:hypothetical protein